ncbi:DUF3667 domain-containing protein [Polaribacter sp.]|uniref:DUF3667 domain-containing protein n=1 Tax=Polaribacter sp. TaxID=1920175 RepID=UPI003F6A9570
MPCINCNTKFEGDFCPTCGEKKHVDRITLKSFVQTVFSGLTEMDKGLLFNLKNLTFYPQKTTLQYIKGKRRQVLNPISYAIITISIYLFLDSILPKAQGLKLAKEDVFGAQEMGVKLGYFIRGKMKFLWLTFIIYISIFTRLFFRKFNFFEHLAINSFIVGHATIVAIITRCIYSKELLIFNFLVYIYMAVLIYKVFKNPKDAFGTGAISFLVVFLSFLLFLGVPFLIVNFFQ